MKNKAPAEVQITAEQLLREAKERELELLPPPPKQKITDQEELNDYKLRKRKVSISFVSTGRCVHIALPCTVLTVKSYYKICEV